MPLTKWRERFDSEKKLYVVENLEVKLKIYWAFEDQEGVYIDEGKEAEDNEFWDALYDRMKLWLEGNWSSDGNRSRFFGIELPRVMAGERYYKDKIKIVAMSVIYPDGAEEKLDLSSWL